MIIDGLPLLIVPAPTVGAPARERVSWETGSVAMGPQCFGSTHCVNQPGALVKRCRVSAYLLVRRTIGISQRGRFQNFLDLGRRRSGIGLEQHCHDRGDLWRRPRRAAV